MVHKKNILMLVFLGIILAGCVDTGDETNGSVAASPIPSSPTENEFTEAGIAVTETAMTDKSVTITYTQPLTDDPEDVYATWAYIFGTALENAPNPDQIETLTIFCNFEDGEKIRVSSDPETVREFLDEEIDAWEFLYKLDMEALTKGPQIWEG